MANFPEQEEVMPQRMRGSVVLHELRMVLVVLRLKLWSSAGVGSGEGMQKGCVPRYCAQLIKRASWNGVGRDGYVPIY